MHRNSVERTTIVMLYHKVNNSFIKDEQCLTSGKSRNTSDISFPLSPQPTYTIASELENLERDWEITVLPHPKAPGIAVVPPWTHLEEIKQLRVCLEVKEIFAVVK